MKHPTPKSNEIGLTIVELLIVLTIVFIVSAFAFLQVDSSKESLEMQNVSKELSSYLERARFDSVKRNASKIDQMAKVTISGPTSFTSFTDFDLDGKLDAKEKRNIDFSHQDQIKFFSGNLVFPVVISFNSRGQTTAIDGNGNAFIPTFIICKNDCEHIATIPESYQIVSVTPTGTVTIFNGDELLNVPEPPTNINTDTSSDIKPLASTISNDGSIPIID